MLYIDNLCEFVKQVIDRQLAGTFHLQNKEYADTVEIVRYYAKAMDMGCGVHVCLIRWYGLALSS